MLEPEAEEILSRQGADCGIILVDSREGACGLMGYIHNRHPKRLDEPGELRAPRHRNAAISAPAPGETIVAVDGVEVQVPSRLPRVLGDTTLKPRVGPLGHKKDRFLMLFHRECMLQCRYRVVQNDAYAVINDTCRALLDRRNGGRLVPAVSDPGNLLHL